MPGTVTLVDGSVVTFTLAADGKSLSWSSPDMPLDAVMMKAGDGAYIYTYVPEATSDSDLITPDNNGGQRAYLSHVNFCYDLELKVVKTASTSFTRDHDWSIQKSAAQTSITLSLGQYFDLAFTVTVSSSSSDSGWAVAGTITVTNPDPDNAAEVASITDTLESFGAIAVDCGEGVTFPLTLAKAGDDGDSIVCTYATGLPDNATRLNTATATAQAGSVVGSGSGTAQVVFSDEASTINTVDGCVDVTDTHQGSLGQVCAADGSQTFNYTVPLHFTECGPSELTNTASFTSTSSDETGSSTVVVAIDVPCVGGCTLTQGYWKTHSINGPAPYDDTWGGRESDPFFSSGDTWYGVLWTPPQGNVYYVLAHQYIAAFLNVLNGAGVPASIQTALAQAETLLSSTTPGVAKGLKGAAKQTWTTTAFLLDQYNNGITGPGHCSE